MSSLVVCKAFTVPTQSLICIKLAADELWGTGIEFLVFSFSFLYSTWHDPNISVTELSGIKPRGTLLMLIPDYFPGYLALFGDHNQNACRRFLVDVRCYLSKVGMVLIPR